MKAFCGAGLPACPVVQSTTQATCGRRSCVCQVLQNRLGHVPCQLFWCECRPSSAERPFSSGSGPTNGRDAALSLFTSPSKK